MKKKMTADDAIKITMRMLEYIEEEQGCNPDFLEYGKDYHKVRNQFFKHVLKIDPKER